MNNKIVDKYMNEGLAKGEMNGVSYQFIEVSDGLEDLLVNAESLMDDYGSDPVIMKALHKNGMTLEKLIRLFGKQVIEPMMKKYK